MHARTFIMVPEGLFLACDTRNEVVHDWQHQSRGSSVKRKARSRRARPNRQGQARVRRRNALGDTLGLVEDNVRPRVHV